MSEFPMETARIVRRWEHNGIDCVIAEGPGGGWCNGYVRVPDDHVARHIGYQRPEVDVHGGLTYGEDGWFGFNTAHGGDNWTDEALSAVGMSAPSYRSGLRVYTEWNIDKLVAETERLADQFAAMTSLGRASSYSITDAELTALYDEIDRYRAGEAS